MLKLQTPGSNPGTAAWLAPRCGCSAQYMQDNARTNKLAVRVGMQDPVSLCDAIIATAAVGRREVVNNAHTDNNACVLLRYLTLAADLQPGQPLRPTCHAVKAILRPTAQAVDC